MSHEIAYDKQFIKVSDNQYVPMVLSGSNNCTEFTNGRERRARSWYPWNLGNKLVFSKEELIEFNKKVQLSLGLLSEGSYKPI